MLMIEDKIAKMVDIVAEEIKCTEIGCYDDDGTMKDSWNTYLENLLMSVDPDVKVCYGVSKMVIVPSFGDIVIKFPLRGSWYDGDDCGYWDEETDEYIEGENEYNFCEYSYGGGDDGSDYCALEVSMYNDIIKQAPDCARVFPETKYYKEVKGTMFYTQKKCVELYEFETEEVTENSKKEGKELFANQSTIDSDYWIQMLVEKLGYILAQKILNFIEDYGISDLHNHNIGFDIKTGIPMIIDFCGFES